LFVGHYSVSFAAKSAEKAFRSGLFLAVQWIDVDVGHLCHARDLEGADRSRHHRAQRP
jgi:hypothetical protein